MLKATLAKIEGAKTKEALYEQMGLLVKDGYQMPFEYDSNHENTLKTDKFQLNRHHYSF